jgi:hypothetical protein
VISSSNGRAAKKVKQSEMGGGGVLKCGGGGGRDVEMIMRDIRLNSAAGSCRKEMMGKMDGIDTQSRTPR